MYLTQGGTRSLTIQSKVRRWPCHRRPYRSRCIARQTNSIFQNALKYVCVAACIPGHALHEMGLKKQQGDSPLVSSQERRAAVVPRIHPFSNAGPTRAWFPHRFTLDFACSRFWRDVQDMCVRCHGGYEGRLSPGRTDRSASRPARPCPAPPRRARPRPDPPVVCPGFGFDRYTQFVKQF